MKTTKKEFKALGSTEQWQWVLNHKNEIILILDVDETSFVFLDEVSDDDPDVYDLKDGLGNEDGIMILLTLIGIQSEYC